MRCEHGSTLLDRLGRDSNVIEHEAPNDDCQRHHENDLRNSDWRHWRLDWRVQPIPEIKKRVARIGGAAIVRERVTMLLAAEAERHDGAAGRAGYGRVNLTRCCRHNSRLPVCCR